MALDESNDNDNSYDFDGITYVIDKKLLEELGNVSVDFVEKGWRSGFVVSSERPLEAGASSCGGGCSC